jgi:cysteine desulfurase
MYVRPGTDIEPFLHGGGHEQGLRSGTLAVHQIVGFGKAVEIAIEAMRHGKHVFSENLWQEIPKKQAPW